MTAEKKAIFGGLGVGLLFLAFLVMSVISGCATVPVSAKAPAPLSAIAVTQCGLAVSLFIQLDANHLFRADPRQSDLFTNVGGKMQQAPAAPMAWKDAYELAGKATLSTHVVIPCTDGPTI